jgi:hypothetical protein
VQFERDAPQTRPRISWVRHDSIDRPLQVTTNDIPHVCLFVRFGYVVFGDELWCRFDGFHNALIKSAARLFAPAELALLCLSVFVFYLQIIILIFSKL